MNDRQQRIFDEFYESRLAGLQLSAPKVLKNVELTPDELDLLERLRGQVLVDGTQTLEEFLDNMIRNDPVYKNLPKGEGGGREAAVQKAINASNKLAQKELFDRSPKLQKAIADEDARKRELRTPVPQVGQ